jgi:hypothetical protein
MGSLVNAKVDGMFCPCPSPQFLSLKKEQSNNVQHGVPPMVFHTNFSVSCDESCGSFVDETLMTISNFPQLERFKRLHSGAAMWKSPATLLS